MGLIDKILGKKPQTGKPVEAGTLFETLTAYRPVFQTWGGELYESELCRAAIDAVARHFSKTQITIHGSAQPKLQTRLKQAPNSFQTWSQFLYRFATILMAQNTAFIVPVLSPSGEVLGIYPVLPSRCELVEYDGDVYLRYAFGNGKKAAVLLNQSGICTRHQYKDDIFGEKNSALTGTMQLLDLHSQAIGEAVSNSNSFRFMAQATNFIKPDDLPKEAQRFTESNLRSDSGGGVLLFPNYYTNIQQIKSTPYVADSEQYDLIRTNVFDYFGVNEAILQNSAQGDALDAFFNGVIEPLCIQLSDVLTNMLFTERERASKAAVFVTADRLQYMNTTTKISMAKEMGDRGVLMIDEIRALFNYAPLPDGAGQHAPIRGEYKMVDQKAPDETDTNDSEAKGNE